MPSNSVHVVTGGSKGIGFALVKELSARPNAVIIATARVPANAAELQELAAKHSNIHVLAYDASKRGDGERFAKDVSNIVDGVDVLHANAGVFEAVAPVLETSPSLYERHIAVNFVGPIELIQAFYPLLKQRSTRKVVITSTTLGSSGAYLPVEMSAYGSSKAALNFVTKALSSELASENFIFTALHPGIVATDEALVVLTKVGGRNPQIYTELEPTVITPEQSAKTQLKTVDALTAESNGKFIDVDGSELPYESSTAVSWVA